MKPDKDGVVHMTCDEDGKCVVNSNWIVSQIHQHGIETCCESPALSKKICGSVLEKAGIPFVVDPPAKVVEPEAPGT